MKLTKPRGRGGSRFFRRGALPAAVATRAVLYTPFRRGGPRSWGLAMARELAPEVDLVAVNSPALAAKAPFLGAQVVHSALPFVRTRKPLLLTLKGDFRRESRLYRRGYERILRRADAVTVPSRYLQETLRLPDAEVIPNAVPLTPPVWDPPAEGPLRLLVVSKFAFEAKTRGILDLLDSLGAARREGKLDFQVTVVGGGAFEGLVAERIRSLGEGFRFHGWSDDVRGLFARHHALLYVSYLDNQPNLLLEAMMAGIPVYSNPAGDVPNMLPEECVFHDATAVAQVLPGLASDAQRRRVSRENHRRAAERVSGAAVKPAWLAAYERVQRR